MPAFIPLYQLLRDTGTIDNTVGRRNRTLGGLLSFCINTFICFVKKAQGAIAMHGVDKIFENILSTSKPSATLDRYLQYTVVLGHRAKKLQTAIWGFFCLDLLKSIDSSMRLNKLR